MCLLRGITLIYINVCIFHSLLCFPTRCQQCGKKAVFSEHFIFRMFLKQFFSAVLVLVTSLACLWGRVLFGFSLLLVLGLFCFFKWRWPWTWSSHCVFQHGISAVLQLWSCRLGTLPVFTSFSPSIDCLQTIVLVICMLQLVPKRSQNNAYYRKAGGQSWPGMFSLPLVEIHRVWVFCCLKPHFGWRGRILKEASRSSRELHGVFNWQSDFCCCSSISPNLSFCERKTTFSFCFLPLRCSCYFLTVTKSFLLSVPHKSWEYL